MNRRNPRPDLVEYLQEALPIGRAEMARVGEIPPKIQCKYTIYNDYAQALMAMAGAGGRVVSIEELSEGRFLVEYDHPTLGLIRKKRSRELEVFPRLFRAGGDLSPRLKERKINSQAAFFRPKWFQARSTEDHSLEGIQRCPNCDTIVEKPHRRRFRAEFRALRRISKKYPCERIEARKRQSWVFSEIKRRHHGEVGFVEIELTLDFLTEVGLPADFSGCIDPIQYLSVEGNFEKTLDAAKKWFAGSRKKPREASPQEREEEARAAVVEFVTLRALRIEEEARNTLIKAEMEELIPIFGDSEETLKLAIGRAALKKAVAA